MMVASIGMQFFNNYANSKKNEEIQEKQREFQRAAAEHDFERMRKLQAESAKLAFIVSIMRGFAAITFFAFLLSKIFGLTGIWSAFPAAEFLTMFVTVYGLFKIHRPA